MFYDVFLALCQEKGVPPTRAATEIGLSKSTPTTWKKRGLTPQGDTLSKIAEYFNVTTDYLLSGDTTKKALSHEDERFASACKNFRNKLRWLMDISDPDDISAAGIDAEELKKVITGEIPLTLELVLFISDEFGIDNGLLLGNTSTEALKAALNNEDSLTAEIIKLLLSLPEQKRQEALNYLRYLSETSKNQ